MNVAQKLLLLLAAVASMAATCSDNDPAEGNVLHVVASEPAADEFAPLGDGEMLDQTREESREALMIVLGGIPSPAGDEPLKFGLMKAIAGEMYMDIDEVDGPEQWITVAEIQDDDGNVLWFDRVNSIFQLLEYLEVVMNQQSSINFGINQVFSFVSQQYPQLLDFGVKVPLGIEGGTQYVLKVPRDDGTLYEAFRSPIADLVDAAQPPELTAEVATILDNGEPRDKIDIVIMGDGYSADEREKFELDAQAIADRFARAEPFATKIADFNIHTLWIPSVESGAGYDCTGNILADNGCKNDLRDTVFQTTFVLTALADRFQLDLQDTSDRVAMPLQVGALFDVASNTAFDEIIMVSNTRRSSGFAGLYVAVLTAYDGRLGFPDTAVHEFGHSFGVLGDEYNIDGDPCLRNEPAIPLPANISSTADRSELKWAHLVPEDTPLPTSRGEGDTGAFLGAYNCDELYRPTFNCRMRDSDQDFCAVCTEQLASRIFAYVDPYTSAAATAERAGDELVFTVPARDETIAVEWLLGEESVGEGTELRLEADKVPQAWTQLRAVAGDATGLIVGDKPRTNQTINWWIRR